MIKRIAKVFFLVTSTFSILYGVLLGLQIMLYPHVYLPLSESWKNMLFYFAHGLWAQYIALHSFTDQDVQKENN